MGLLESREQRCSCHRETIRASRDEALDKCSYVSTTTKEEEEGAIRNIKIVTPFCLLLYTTPTLSLQQETSALRRNFMGHYLLKIVNLLSSLLVVFEDYR